MMKPIKLWLHNVYVLVVLFICMFAAVSIVYAATHSMTGPGGSGTGYGWASNIGWIDMSGVQYDDVTGKISGYAWSSTGLVNGNETGIGWIRFGDFQNCPTGSSVAECGSRLNTDDPNNPYIEGWARACSAATSNGTNCPLNGTSQNPAAGGWDGWISLGCENESTRDCSGTPSHETGGNPDKYGWRVAQNGDISGYAWGGMVIGWMQAANLNIGIEMTPVAPTLTLEAYNLTTNATIPDGSLVDVNHDVDVRWTISPTHDSTVCTVSGFTLPASMVRPPNTNYAVSGNRPQAPLTANRTYTYTMQCTNEGGTSAVVSTEFTVPAPPTVTLDAYLNGSATPTPYPPTIIVTSGDALELEWEATSVPGDSLSCEELNGSGFDTGAGEPASGRDGVNIPAVNNFETYQVRCTGLGGDTVATVVVEHPAPAVEIRAIPSMVNIGGTTDVSYKITGRTPAMCTLTGAGLPGSPITLSLEEDTYSGITINGETDFVLHCNAEGITPEDEAKATVNVSQEVVET